MTEAQKKFVELEKQKEAIKAFHEEFSAAIASVKAEVGFNGFFQDHEGTVYKIIDPTGRWLNYEKIDYTRTRRSTEEKSPRPLSIKEAEIAGYNVPKK